MPPHEKQTNSRNFRTPSSQVSRVCFDYQTTYYHPPPLPDDFLLHSCYKYKINVVTLRLTPPDSFASCTPLTPLFHSAYFSTSFCSFDWPKTFLISTSTNINTNSATAGNLKHIPEIFLFVLLGLRTADWGLWTTGFAAATNPSDIWHLPHSELYQTEPNKPNQANASKFTHIFR